MRPNQSKRMRGRSNNRKGPNPLSRTYESNGPDVKIRGTAHHIGEKYLQLARDAQSAGDPVMAESFLQHAEHYFRLIAAAQAAQQSAQGYHRQAGEPETEDFEEEEELAGGMDRFASPLERANPPQPVYPAPAASQPAAPERPSYGNGERALYDRPERPLRQERGFQERGYAERGAAERQGASPGEPRGGRGTRAGRDYRLDGRYGRNETRGDGAEGNNKGLPAFITSPVRIQAEPHLDQPDDQPVVARVLDDSAADNEAAGYHLRPRRRRSSKVEMGDGPADISQARDPVGD